jgi:DNA polymerase-1
MRPILYLIDGTALLYRSFYAFIKNPLINSKRQHTSAIFGVINTFLHLLERKEAEHILISFDRKAPTFRHELSEDYKANRPPMPEDLISQVEPVKQFFSLIGMPEISLDGYEADDVLGTLAMRYRHEFDIVLVTADKDYSQLVEGNITIFDPSKDITLDREGVYNRFGVYPEQFVDYLALVGDSSDNIPGVKGIGPKGAVKLLSEFKTLDGIYSALDKIPEKTRKLLEQDMDNAVMSRQLARIVQDVPVEFPASQKLRFRRADLAGALDFLSEYELLALKRSIENRFLPKDAPTRPEEEPEEVRQADIFAPESTEPDAPLNHNEEMPFKAILADPSNLPALLQKLKTSEQVSIDTETDSTDPMLAALVGISLCVDASEAWYLPLAHQMHDNLPMQETIAELQTALAAKLLMGHNLKYDLIVLKRHGWDIANPLFDTMLAAYILDPGTMQYSLDACSLAELNRQMIPISKLIGAKASSQITFDLVDVEKACVYSAEDAWTVLMLHPIYTDRLKATGLDELFRDVEIPLLKVLQRMEENGVVVDSSVLHEISYAINLELKKISEEIYAYAGYQFNLNSTQQLGRLLFEEKGIQPRRKTKSGFSTDNAVLEELAEDHAIAATLMQYRMLSKLESTYVGALPKLVNPTTGRIHSSFNQTIASTGRLSSSNPNLQNIPIRSELGRSIRKAFVARDPGWMIVAADYSQIELRLLALMSRDEVLLRAFQEGMDIHRQMAAIITGKSLEDVSSEERRRAKVINFGLLYGMGQRKLSRELGISLAQAKDMIRDYFDRFPSIRDYIRSSIEMARGMHYCQTLFGRKLYLRNINSQNPGLKSEAERVAVNMPIQGTAADLIKIAMRDIHALIADDDGIRMILQVHDELVFEVRADRLAYAETIIRKHMENALPQQYSQIVQLRTDIGSGASWFDAH